MTKGGQDARTLVALLDHVYGATVDPDRYDDLMEAWDHHISQITQDMMASRRWRSETLTDEEVEHHFSRAFDIFERMGRTTYDSASLDDLATAYPNPALIASLKGVVLAVNQMAADSLALAQGDMISALALDHDSRNRLDDFVQKARKGATHLPPQVLRGFQQAEDHDADRDEGMLYLVSLFAPGHSSINDPAQDLYLLITAAAVIWSDRLERTIADAFGLTKAELGIVAGIVQGKTVNQIAKERGRALETVRSQLKSVQQKSGAHSQSDLVRMVTSLLFLCNDSEPPRGRAFSALGPVGPSMSGLCSEHYLYTDDGRRIAFTKQGHPNGRPIMFLHGMLQASTLPRGAIDALAQLGLTMISPSRPGYGETSPIQAKGKMVNTVTADLLALMGHLDIDRCPMIGHMAGLRYLAAAAKEQPGRFTKLVAISGSVPLVSAEQISQMSARQQLVARTAQFAPRMLPLITRAAVALIDNGGEERFVRALYDACDVDMACLKDPDLHALVLSGSRHTTMQGPGGFCEDAFAIMGDWSADIDNAQLPLLTIHGAQDAVTKIEFVRDFVGRRDFAQLEEIEDGGQLILYSHWHRIFDRIDAFLNEAV